MQRPHFPAPATGGTDDFTPTACLRDDHAIGLPLAVPRNRGRVVRTSVARMDVLFQTGGIPQPDPRPVLGGREYAPGSRRSNDRDLGTTGSSSHYRGLCFDRPVEPGGYAWWYVDALSDDGAYALTVIAFVGSVFSPYYAWARRRGSANPYNYCSLNVALYGNNSARWTMTERGEKRLRRSASVLSIGPSHMRWTGSALEIEIDERGAPLPRRVCGKIRLFPSHLNDRSFALDPAGRHQWTPYAPCSRVEVELSQPALRWSGNGYFDANFGAASLETDFKNWTWSRASGPQGTSVLYDVIGRDAKPRSLALRFSDFGRTEAIEPPPTVQLPNSKWGVKRQTRAEFGCEPRIVKTLEDAPFYSRTLLDTSVLGVKAAAVHESLDLDRFSSRWVQCLLPFRMPRLAL